MSRILIADDDTQLLESFSEMLTDRGHEVLTATNGRRVLARICAMKRLPSREAEDIGGFPAGHETSFATDVSADGRVVAGGTIGVHTPVAVF